MSAVPYLTGNRCQCPSCGRLFTSPREFDRHRVGDFARRSEWHDARRCLSLAELIAKGWRTNARGFWMQGRPNRAPAGVCPVPEEHYPEEVAGGPRDSQT